MKKEIKNLNYRNNSILEFNKRIDNFNHPKITPDLNNLQSIVYNFDYKNSNIRFKNRLIKILENFFMSFSSLISKPKFIVRPDKIIIRLYYYIGTNKNNFKRRNFFKNKLVKSLKNDLKDKNNNSNFNANTDLSSNINYSSSPLNLNLNWDNYFLQGKGLSQLGIFKKIFESLFKKEVEFQLIKLYNIGHEPYILSKGISLNTVNFRFRLLLNKIWKKVAIYKSTHISYIKNNIVRNITPIKFEDGKISVNQDLEKSLRQSIARKKILFDNINNPSEIITTPTTAARITGIKIRLAGRLVTERVTPKKTVQTFQIGSLDKKLVTVVNSASFTSKNKRGAFNIKVWVSYTTN